MAVVLFWICAVTYVAALLLAIGKTWATNDFQFDVPTFWLGLLALALAAKYILP